MWYIVVWCGLWGDVVRPAGRFGAACGSVWCGDVVWRGVVWCGLWGCLVQPVGRFGVVWCGLWGGLVWYCVVLCGGVVWFGAACGALCWYGVFWCGVVRPVGRCE